MQRVLPNCPLINNARAVGAWQPFPLNGETWFPSHRCILPISRHFSWPEEVPGALCQCCISVSESRFASSCRGSTGQQKGMLVEENVTQRSGFFQSLQHPLVERWTKSDEMDSVLLSVPRICSATSDPELVLVQVTQRVCTTLCCAVLCLAAQLCPTLCDPVDCSPPRSSVHGISQARALEWAAIPFSRGSSQPRD